MSSLAEQILSCRDCGLWSGGGPVPPSGSVPSPSGLAAIGQNPWVTEVREGRPFVGESGTELDTALELSGLDRFRVPVGNVVCCKPPSHTPPAESVEACLLNFVSQVVEFEADVILGLGRPASIAIDKFFGNGSFRGSTSYGSAISLEVPYGTGRAFLVPTWHPSPRNTRDASKRRSFRAAVSFAASLAWRARNGSGCLSVRAPDLSSTPSWGPWWESDRRRLLEDELPPAALREELSQRIAATYSHPYAIRAFLEFVDACLRLTLDPCDLDPPSDWFAPFRKELWAT